jgi:hypothetical protein
MTNPVECRKSTLDPTANQPAPAQESSSLYQPQETDNVPTDTTSFERTLAKWGFKTPARNDGRLGQGRSVDGDIRPLTSDEDSRT